MPDQRPPRLVTDERDTLQAMLQFQRDSLVRKVIGVDEEAAGRSPVGSGTTLLWLVRHLARAELVWVAYRFAGEDITVADDEVPPGDTLAAAIDAYRDTWVRVDAIISAASLDDTCRRTDHGGSANLRWVLTHLLGETARHAGHADILRELIDCQTGR